MKQKYLQDVIKLVEKLTKSCIRFIHFSSDNEQISRVIFVLIKLFNLGT